MFAFHGYMFAQERKCSPLTETNEDYHKAIALMTIGGKSYTGSLVNNNNPGESGKNYFITTSLPFNGSCSN